MNITIKDLPDDVHRQLKERAEESGRSLNKMIVHLLACETRPRKIDRTELLGEIRAFRETLPRTTAAEIESAIAEGRESAP